MTYIQEDLYKLCSRTLRRSNRKEYDFILQRRRNEVLGAISEWLCAFYSSDDGKKQEFDRWQLTMSGTRFLGTWAWNTGQVILWWTERSGGEEIKWKAARYIKDTLSEFWKYCDKHYAKAKFPVVPPYPSFDEFLQDRSPRKRV